MPSNQWTTPLSSFRGGLHEKSDDIYILALVALVAGNAFAADGNVNFVLGQRNLSDDLWDFESLDTQPAFGVNADYLQLGLLLGVSW